MKPIVAPSLLSADFGNLEKDVQMLNRSQADWIHLDVMDGVFVPNISFGMPVIKRVRQLSEKPLDVHLMIVQPERYIHTFKEVGADLLTVHWEASTHLHRTICQIKEEGMLAGVALNPHTPVAGLEDIINDVNLVLIMSVNPGFGGQKFIKRALHKISELREMIERNDSEALIEVDGGVCQDNIADIVSAGADAVVAGNAVFKAEDPEIAIQNLKNA
ncbi:MAG: ribulose-phosphate 3-epimerase [Bacteroidales bacterium]|nr:ribulose-phosphate 3-epimerase [Bacteroidales bacterium]